MVSAFKKPPCHLKNMLQYMYMKLIMNYTWQENCIIHYVTVLYICIIRTSCYSLYFWNELTDAMLPRGLRLSLLPPAS